MHYSKLFFLSITVVFMFSCKGPKGEPGPAATEVVKEDANSEITKEGFVKGVFLGKAEDKDISQSFEFTGVDRSINSTYYYDSDEDSLQVEIEKIYFPNSSELLDGYIRFSFNVKDLEKISNASINTGSFSYTKVLENKELLDVDINSYYRKDNKASNSSSKLTGKVSNLIYDKTTSTISGQFEIKVEWRSYNSTSMTYTPISMHYINNGFFKTKLLKIIFNNRMGKY